MKPFDIVRWIVFAAALVPAVALVYWTFTGDTGPNPIDFITDTTGTTALTFLILSLTVTPLRRITARNELIKLRRMLGLFAFFYAMLHMLTWVVFVHFFDVTFMIEDVVKRPFITVGMATFLILFALAITSNRFSIRRLGRRWQTLHRFVYLAAIGGVVHFWWLVKADLTLPIRWAVVVGFLLGFRVWWSWRAQPQRAAMRKA